MTCYDQQFSPEKPFRDEAQRRVKSEEEEEREIVHLLEGKTSNEVQVDLQEEIWIIH